MARGGGQIFQMQQTPLAPNTAQAVGAGLQDFSQMLLQHFAQKEQLALQKEALKLQQQEFKLVQDKREAEGQAALQAIQSSPDLLALLGASGGANSTLQAPNLPAQARGAYAASQGAPAPSLAQTSQTQAPLAPARAGSGALTPDVAAALLPVLQEQRRTNAQLRESDARVAASRADVRKTELEERRLAFEIDNAPKLFAANMARIAADTAASQASAASSRAQAETARGQLALSQRQYEGALREAAATQVNKLDERFANAIASGMDRITASRWIYGTPTPPQRKALISTLAAELDPLVQAAGSAEDVNSLLEARTTQQTIDRLGISEPLQTAVISAVQANTAPDGSIDFIGVFEDARRSGMKDEDKARVALMVEAYTGQMPDLSTIPEHKSVLRRVLSLMSASPGTGGAAMVPR